MITVNVTLFGRLSDYQTLIPKDLSLPTDSLITDLLEVLYQLDPMIKQQLTDTNITIACNDQIAPQQQLLHDGDQLALLPPVTGG